MALKIDRIREIIREEIALAESDDRDGIKDVVNAAVALSNAIEKFEKTATSKQKSALEPAISTAKKHLDAMLEAPMSYVDATPNTAKKVVYKKAGPSTI